MKLRSWRERIRDLRNAERRKHLTPLPDLPCDPDPELRAGWGLVPTSEDEASWKAEHAARLAGRAIGGDEE
jgi:hypothetical protein